MRHRERARGRENARDRERDRERFCDTAECFFEDSVLSAGVSQP